MVEGQDIATYSGLTALTAWCLRKAWQHLTSANADGEKAKADATVFENMRKELERLASEMRELKLEHKKEKLELERRITDLEANVQRMTFRLGHVRQRALSAYSSLLSNNCKNCIQINDATGHLQAILEEE